MKHKKSRPLAAKPASRKAIQPAQPGRKILSPMKRYPGPEPQLQSRGPKLNGLSFPVVGIGASAGGLEVFTHLLENLPVDTGMAFVLVQHLDPSHESLLTELLSKTTALPVTQVTNGMVIVPNHVYIIPANTEIILAGRVLKLRPRSLTRGQHMPVDVFFRSLAEVQQHQAIGVILSGTASDGVLGIQAIKAHGGITMAQDEQSAKHSSMPRNAVLTGCVDYVLPPDGLASELARIGQHPMIKPAQTKHLAQHESAIAPILTLLRTTTGVDFSNYKINTIMRRILRRMALHKIERLDQYFEYLQANPGSVQHLYQDLLIKVTSFFRDPETFEALKTEIFPKILEQQSNGTGIRVWVPGCATGEEAYSIAIALFEFLGDRVNQFRPQIFATDISDTALEAARQGIYVENIALDVSAVRLERFYTKVDQGYQVSKFVRAVCIFAKQDLTRDPPFSKLDLISCRNILIYLGQPLQKKVFPLFHYALKPHGYLVLGSSENISNFSELFRSIDREHKIFVRKPSLSPAGVYFTATYPTEQQGIRSSHAGRDVPEGLELQVEADLLLLSKYTPAGVIVNEQLDVLQFRGQTSPYLEPSPGKPSVNLLKMAREGLYLEVRALVHKAKKTGSPCRKGYISIKFNDEHKKVAVEVLPLKTYVANDACYLVLFKDERSPDKRELQKSGPGRRHENHQLEQAKQELLASREYLQSIIEEQEATNEELKSANEEILSSNEELQSTNEELETAKEELQSTNEELTTVNEELQNRNQELSQVNNDLLNLLADVNIPVVMLGNDLRIRRFTPLAQSVLKLLPADVGRPLTDINHNLSVQNLDELVVNVISSGIIREQEVQDKAGRWYSMRIRPYKTSDHRTEGAVIVLIDIDAFKGSLEELKESRDYAESIIETIWEPLIVLDDQLRVKMANRSFYNTFRVAPEETKGSSLFDLGKGQWDIPKLRTMLESLIPQNGRFQDFEVDNEFPRIGRRTMLLNARVISWEKTRTQMVLLAMQDITERKQVEVDRIKASLREKEVLLKEVHHRVKNNLQIISSLLRLQSETQKDKPPRDVFTESQNRIRSMALIHEKLYHSQDLSKIDFAEYVRNLASNLFLSYDVDMQRIKLEVNVDDVTWDVGTAIPCGLIINELISNSLKHAFPENRKGQIRIELRKEQEKSLLIVADDGVGFPKDMDFHNSNSLGVQLVSMLTEQLNGTIELHSDGKTEFRVLFAPPKRNNATEEAILPE